MSSATTDRAVDEVVSRVNANDRVLFVWSGKQVPESLQQAIERVQAKAGADARVHVEHVDRLGMSNHAKSSFDLIVVNALTPNATSETQSLGQLTSVYLGLLKPKARLVVFVAAADSTILSELKLNGLVNAAETKLDDQLAVYEAHKPNFEVGASSRLKFAAKPAQNAPVAQDKPKVWQFNPNDIAEDDLINTDELLDEVDLKKPVLVDKFDCGESKTGKKKACKNCSCGLAEELEKEASDVQKKNVTESSNNAKSACGSCYLGDAFRCASCPYLGMPAFKPGEKVQLADNLIKSDI